MAQAQTNNVVEVQPAPTIYTLLLLIALLALVAGIGITAHRLLASPPTGYGLSVGDLFRSWEKIQPVVDSGQFQTARNPRRAGSSR